MNTKATIVFGPYKDFKPTTSNVGIRYRYPWDKIKKAGQEYGFFVGVKKKPKPPSTLKYRNWKIVDGEYNGEKGYYIYIHNFNKGYKPEDEQP